MLTQPLNHIFSSDRAPPPLLPHSSCPADRYTCFPICFFLLQTSSIYSFPIFTLYNKLLILSLVHFSIDLLTFKWFEQALCKLKRNEVSICQRFVMVEINYFLPFISTDGILKTFCTKNFRLVLFKNEMRETVRAKLSPTVDSKWIEGRQHDVPKQSESEHSWGHLCLHNAHECAQQNSKTWLFFVTL